MNKTCIILSFLIALAISIKVNRPRLPVHIDRERKCKRACDVYSRIIPTLFYPYINLESYIIDGEFPHLAIVYLVQNLTGETIFKPSAIGSLISDKFVLSDGGLANLRYHSIIKVRLGSAADAYDKDQGKMYEIEAIIPHPSYNKSNPKKIYFNIGLIELKETVEFSYKIRPACLFSDFIVPNINFSSIGWSDSPLPRLDRKPKPLTKAYFSLVSIERCDEIYRNITTLFSDGFSPAIICAEDNETLASHCSGDAGSPLQFIDPKNEMYTVLALTSFGDHLCLGTLPGGFINVTHYLDWIENVTWPFL